MNIVYYCSYHKTESFSKLSLKSLMLFPNLVYFKTCQKSLNILDHRSWPTPWDMGAGCCGSWQDSSAWPDFLSGGPPLSAGGHGDKGLIFSRKGSVVAQAMEIKAWSSLAKGLWWHRPWCFWWQPENWQYSAGWSQSHAQGEGRREVTSPFEGRDKRVGDFS